LDMTTVAKMKSIQADADAAQVVAESGAASQQLHEALVELGRLDDELKKAKERASELIAAAQKQLSDAGKDEQEAADLLRVCMPKNTLIVGCVGD
jgi:chemotaxis regulatin CheY-phosphate phosphatase CheZ